MNESVRNMGEPVRSVFADDPEMVELVELFVSELPDRVRAISDAAREGRAGDLRDLAHQLKGAAGGYGFGIVSEAAAEVEAPLRSGGVDLNSVRSKVDDLVDLCSRVTADAE
ncbi:MAG: Hpt domain-containing protein [Planctomycetota bacterium]